MKTTKRAVKWMMVVRESVSAYEREVLQSEPVRSSASVANLLRERLGRLPHEEMVVVLLDGQSHVMGMTTVVRGGRHELRVSLADLFRVACATAASAVILVHNHPSGDPTPSLEDVTLTRRAVEAGAVIGIQVVDHVIIAGTRHASLLDLGLGDL